MWAVAIAERASSTRAIHRLSALKVTNLRQPGYYADGGNLCLRIAPGGSKGWIFRFTLAGRKRDAGLGAFPAVSLMLAREEAQRCRRACRAMHRSDRGAQGRP